MIRVARYRRLLAMLALLVGVFVAAAPRPAAADEYADLVHKLGSDSFDDKEAAIKALGGLGDDRAIKVLQALNDGNLMTTTEGNNVVIASPAGDDYNIVDAVDGKPLGKVDSDKVNSIIANDQLRSDIQDALSGLQIFSKDPKVRLQAALDAAGNATPKMVGELSRAIAVETNPDIKEAMLKSLAAVYLKVGTVAQKLQAIKELSDSMAPSVDNMLRAAVDNTSNSKEVRDAALAAAESIEGRLKYVAVGANLVEGISLGSVLLLAAIGLAITFGLMGVINMAHGEMMMLGAYTTYVVQEAFVNYLPPSVFGLYLIVSIPAAFLVAGGVGVLLERSVIRFLYGRPLETLLATWGISLVLQQAVRTIFGAPNKAVANPAWMTGGFNVIGGFTITWNRLYIVVFCFLVLGTLALVLARTSYGLYVRAVTQNRPIASVMGIPTARIDALTFGLGSGIAGMAGVALSQIGNVSPNLGTIYIVDSFLVVVLGGVGSLMGTLVGAMGLGIVNIMLEPFAGAVLGKVVVLVAVILFIQKRPRGLFALKGRAAET
ncbi:MAG TPA: urea ABC transporter permease subunit UrtB [Alphaproteobacteria bacterium]|nr:urea ABC transporter permease subunit UrtB [Alphaproteobacteria bacterium]